MTVFLLDSSAYFRLAKSFHPLLGQHKGLSLKLLGETADEFSKQLRLRSKFAWFSDQEFADNRQENILQLTAEQIEDVKHTAFWLKDWVRDQRAQFVQKKLNPPSPVDCRVLAHAIVPGITVIADDAGLEFLAKESDLAQLGSQHLLKKLLDAGALTVEKIQAAAKYLDYEGDLPGAWKRESQALFGCKLP